MKRRHRILTVVTALITFFVVLMYPSAAATNVAGNMEEVSQSTIQAAPGVRLLWKNQDGSTAKVDDFNCADTGTCITCEVAAYTPWQDAVSPIINYAGEVNCFQPAQGNRPAVVPYIEMQVGLWDFIQGYFVKLKFPPAQANWVSHLGPLIDAVPMNGCGVYQTAVFVTVFFPECCPLNASSGFGSDPIRIGC